MTAVTPPTLTINSSLIIESNPLIAQLAARVGATAQQSEFFAAVVDFLQQLAAADTDALMSSTHDQQIAHKKRKRMSGDEGGDTDVDSNKQIVQFMPPHLTLSPPAAAMLAPLAPGSMDYTHLPQHIILGIFEFRKLVLRQSHNIASLFCRFRSQISERQFHLQYRSVKMDDETIKLHLDSDSAMFLFMVRQVRYLMLFMDRNTSWQHKLFTASLWPQLGSIEFNANGEHFCDQQIDMLCKIPKYFRERIHVLNGERSFQSLDMHSTKSKRLHELLPNLNNLGLDDNSDIVVSRARKLSCSPLSLEIATKLLSQYPQIQSLSENYDYDDSNDSTLTFKAFVAQLQQLSHLKMLDCSNFHQLQVIPRITSLVRLSIVFNSSFDFAGIDELVNLEYFKLRQSGIDTEHANLLNGDCLRDSKQLSTLSLEHMNLDLKRPDHNALLASIWFLNRRGQLYSLQIIGWGMDKHAELSLQGMGVQVSQLRELIIKYHEVQKHDVDSICTCYKLRKVHVDHVHVHLRWNLDGLGPEPEDPLGEEVPIGLSQDLMQQYISQFLLF